MDDERERTELELAEMELEECQNECDDLAKQLERTKTELTQYIGYKSAAQIEAARADRAEAALAAMPWQTLLNLSNYSELMLERDASALLAFLNQYAPWVRSSNDLLSAEETVDGQR